MLSISFFGLCDRSEFIEDYIKLAKEEFHEEHETIASYFFTSSEYLSFIPFKAAIIIFSFLKLILSILFYKLLYYN